MSEVINSIIIAISGTDLFLEPADYSIDFNSEERDILNAIEPAVRERVGESLKDSNGTFLYKVRKATERGNIYVIPNSTAG